MNRGKKNTNIFAQIRKSNGNMNGKNTAATAAVSYLRVIDHE